MAFGCGGSGGGKIENGLGDKSEAAAKGLSVRGDGHTIIGSLRSLELARRIDSGGGRRRRDGSSELAAALGALVVNSEGIPHAADVAAAAGAGLA